MKGFLFRAGRAIARLGKALRIGSVIRLGYHLKNKAVL
jgi:hypothetical protein